MHSSIIKPNRVNQYTWAVTRPLIQQPTLDVSYFIKSGQLDKPDTMRTVSRKLQDFTLLRKELLYEMPELFLPTFSQLTDPSDMDLRPPPAAWIDATLTKLQSFMDWLQYHPTLKHHDLVMSFVRSSCALQQSVIRDNSFSRRKLMLEKIKDIPLTATSMVSSKDEEYFLTYAQEIMMPLKEHYLNMVLKARHLQHTGQGLKGGAGNDCIHAKMGYLHRIAAIHDVGGTRYASGRIVFGSIRHVYTQHTCCGNDASVCQCHI